MKEAVTFGRYNVFSYGHISTLIEILKRYSKINIGLIIDGEKTNIDIDNELCRIYELADKNYIDKELYPVEIRKQMIIAGIQQFDDRLMERVNIELIRRPEYFKKEFNKYFPIEKYDLVFPKSDDEKNEFDILRNEYMGIILERKIYFVNPKLIIHNSDIKEQRSKYIPSKVIKIIDDYKKNNIER